MKQYIDKSAVLLEIERRIQFFMKELRNSSSDIVIALFGLKSFLDTFEVKDVDLEKEIEWIKHIYKVDDNRHTSICSADIEWLAEHFFELGLKAQKGE